MIASATLMPKSEIDPLCNCKKKFIGNDFVSVVFNDSGSPYVLGTISGKFAHVALEVVIFHFSSSLFLSEFVYSSPEV